MKKIISIIKSLVKGKQKEQVVLKQSTGASFWLMAQESQGKEETIQINVKIVDVTNYLTDKMNSLLKRNDIEILSDGSLSKRLWIALPENTIKGRSAGQLVNNTTEPDNKIGVVEFRKFSKTDDLPVFSIYRNTSIETENTVNNKETIEEAFGLLANGPVKVLLVSSLEEHLDLATVRF